MRAFFHSYYSIVYYSHLQNHYFGTKWCQYYLEYKAEKNRNKKINRKNKIEKFPQQIIEIRGVRKISEKIMSSSDHYAHGRSVISTGRDTKWKSQQNLLRAKRKRSTIISNSHPVGWVINGSCRSIDFVRLVQHAAPSMNAAPPRQSVGRQFIYPIPNRAFF